MKRWRLQWVCIALVACDAGSGESLYSCDEPGGGADAGGGTGADAALVDAAPVPDAEASAWQFRRAVTVTAPGALSDYPVLVEIPPADPLIAVSMDGVDLRAGSTANPAGGFDLPLYIETFDSAPGARVWVRLPAIAAGDATTFYLFYGAPDVETASDIDAVFPNRFTSQSDLTLGGENSYDAFTLAAGHTLTVTPGAPLVIRAHVIDVAGDVAGTGAGHVGGDNAVGLGPGGGGTSNDAGAGGGGHGGSGGAGGRDPGDTEGPGGGANGADNGQVVDMGSGGGGTDLAAGGAGGAAISFRGHTVSVLGSVTASGVVGDSLVGPQNRAGGGGAGGGILVIAHDVAVSGSLTADGGGGGAGTDPLHDGGGGGGGGRIKLVHSGELDNRATTSVVPGAGGIGGDAANGGPGQAGSVNVEIVAPIEPSAALGPVEALP